MILRIKPFVDRIYISWLHQRYLQLAIPQDIIFLLENLRRQYRIALITNGTSAAQWEKIDKLDLRSCFDLILVSGDLPHEKPNKKIFFQACNLLQVPPNKCLMVGDKLETDILGGLQAQLGGTVWLPLSSHYSLAETDPQPMYILRNVMELKLLLSSWSEFVSKTLRRGRRRSSQGCTLFLQDETTCCASDVRSWKKPKPIQFLRCAQMDEDTNSNASDGS